MNEETYNPHHELPFLTCSATTTNSTSTATSDGINGVQSWRVRSFRDLLIGMGAGFGCFMGLAFLFDETFGAHHQSVPSMSMSTEIQPNNSTRWMPTQEKEDNHSPLIIDASTTRTLHLPHQNQKRHQYSQQRQHQQQQQQHHRRLTSSSFQPRDFLAIGKTTGTDKVQGALTFEACLKNRDKCPRKDAVNPKCRVLHGHFYNTMYNKWLAPYSLDTTEKFQFLEIGFYHGSGFDAYKQMMPQAEMHSIEIACIEAGPVSEGKWPHGNFASKHPNYQHYIDTNQLHCGDANNVQYLNQVWTTHMKRPGAPPLKVVVEDAAHLAHHMATSLFFWFPKIEPGGILIVEDVQPIAEANKFRTHVLPQVMKDLHFCGDSTEHLKDRACFPTLWPLLQSIHCEMHICVFERNQQPAVEHPLEQAAPPPHALDANQCLFHSSD